MEKNPPLEMPLNMQKTIIGASVVDAGHRASMLTLVKMRDTKSTLTAPILSQRTPQTILPTADEKLNAATSAAPALDDRPIDLEYRGMKNGGTKRGNVASAPARKVMMKVSDLKSPLEKDLVRQPEQHALGLLTSLQNHYSGTACAP